MSAYRLSQFPICCFQFIGTLIISFQKGKQLTSPPLSQPILSPPRPNPSPPRPNPNPSAPRPQPLPNPASPNLSPSPPTPTAPSPPAPHFHPCRAQSLETSFIFLILMTNFMTNFYLLISCLICSEFVSVLFVVNVFLMKYFYPSCYWRLRCWMCKIK